MPRKVLISFLGAGVNIGKGNSREYRKTLYKFGEAGFEMETPFIASAIAENEKIDSFIFLGTMKSMWEAVYEHFAKEKKVFDEDYYWKLAEQTDSSNYQTIPSFDLFLGLEKVLGNKSKIIPLYYGLNKNELDYNLEQILGLEKYLTNGDEIFIDITHSFRSLPVFITTALFYLNDVSSKKLYIKGIYYGMADLYSELNFAPVVRLDSVIDTINWIKGAYSFKEFGNAYLISEQIESLDKSLSVKLKNFSDAKNLNLLYELKNQVNSLKALKFDKLSGLANTIIPQTIHNFLKHFDNNQTHSQFQLSIAQWYFENKNYSSSILVLIESIITYICESENFIWQDQEDRYKAKGLLHNFNKYFDVLQIYGPLNTVRNAVAHSINTPENVSKSITLLKKSINQLTKLIH